MPVRQRSGASAGVSWRAAARSTGEGGIQLVEESLGADGAPAIAVLNRVEQQGGGDACFPHAGLGHQRDVFGFRGKLEFGERADLLGVDARLAFEGKGFDGPRLGESGLCDPPRERGLLAMVILRAQQAREEGAIGELVFLGVPELVLDDRGAFLQVQTPEQLLDLVVHEFPSSSDNRKYSLAMTRSVRRSRRSRSNRPYCWASVTACRNAVRGYSR